MSDHFVYIVRCADGSLYTGYATDVVRRVREHNGESTTAGARYTHARRPVTLVHTEHFTSRSAAQKREAAIKKLSKLEKQELFTAQ